MICDFEYAWPWGQGHPKVKGHICFSDFVTTVFNLFSQNLKLYMYRLWQFLIWPSGQGHLKGQRSIQSLVTVLICLYQLWRNFVRNMFMVWWFYAWPWGQGHPKVKTGEWMTKPNGKRDTQGTYNAPLPTIVRGGKRKGAKGPSPRPLGSSTESRFFFWPKFSFLFVSRLDL